MSKLKLLSQVPLHPAGRVPVLRNSLGGRPPPQENDEVDISAPTVVEDLGGDLFDAILEGDGRPLWEEWGQETQDAVVEWVESSVSGVVTSGQKRDGTAPGESADEDSSSGCDTHSVSAIAWVSSRNAQQPVRLYEYKSSTYWCWNGEEITIDPSWTGHPYEYQSFVKFVEHTNSLENGGKGELTHYDYKRGHYKSCLSALKLFCPFNFYPWIEKQQYYDGEVWFRKDNG